MDDLPELSDEEILSRLERSKEAQDFYRFYRETRRLPKTESLVMVVENLLIDMGILKGGDTPLTTE